MSAKNLSAQDRKRAFWFLGQLNYLSARSDKQIYISQISEDFDFEDLTTSRIVEYLIECGFVEYSGDLIEYDALDGHSTSQQAISITEKGMRAISKSSSTEDEQSDCFFPSYVRRFYSCIPKKSLTYSVAPGVSVTSSYPATRRVTREIPAGSEQLLATVEPLKELSEVIGERRISVTQRRLLNELINELSSQSVGTSKWKRTKARLLDFLKTVGAGVPGGIVVGIILYLLQCCLPLLHP
jgi:hypothetical protein